MAFKIIYIVQPFSVGDGDQLIAEMPIPAVSEAAANGRAQRIAEQYPGVVAFAFLGDLDRGEYNGAKILAKHGSLPPHVK